MSDHYDTLGVARNATPEEIKKAYRRKAKAHHPDREHGDLETMQRIQKAYDTLSDTQKRARYDATGDDGPRPKTPQEVAADLISSVISQILDSDFDGNIVSELNSHFKKQLADCTKKNAACERKIEKLKKRGAAIKSKGETNLFHEIIEEKIRGMQRSIDNNKSSALMCEEALKILADYKDSTIVTPDLYQQTEDQLMGDLIRSFGKKYRW